MKKLTLLLALTMILFSCKPEAEKPKVTTKSVGEVTETTAKVVGQVTADGGAEVTERGVCWNTEGAPEVIDYRTVDGTGIGTFNSNISDLVPNTQYYVRAYATNEVGTSYGEEVTFTTKDVPAVAVDLGLSVKWATCNVGATTPEEYGDYFAWGETTTRETYTEETYNVSMNDISGNAQYDAATANWGGDWRMPTYDELNELINNCTWTWTTQNGVNGYNVEGPNGNSIFLPAAGHRLGPSLYSAGSYGIYWSSTPYENDGGYSAYYFGFDSDSHHMANVGRYYGQSVRPVLE